MEKTYVLSEGLNGQLDKGFQQYAKNRASMLWGKVASIPGDDRKFLRLFGTNDEIADFYKNVLSPLNIKETDETIPEKVVVKRYEIQGTNKTYLYNQMTPKILYKVSLLMMPEGGKHVLNLTGEEENINKFLTDNGAVSNDLTDDPNPDLLLMGYMNEAEFIAHQKEIKNNQSWLKHDTRNTKCALQQGLVSRIIL